MPEQIFRSIIHLDGRFKDREMEDRFLDKDWLHYSHRLRIIFLLTGFAYLGGILVDLFTLGEGIVFYRMLTLRIITFLAAMISILFTIPSDGYKRIQRVIFAYYIIICFSECLELSCKPELGSESIPFLLFINITYFVFFAGQMPYLLLAGLTGTGAYGFVLIFLNHAPPGHATQVLLTFLFITLLSLYYTRNINRSKRMEFFAVNEMKEANTRLQKEIESRKAAEEKLTALSYTDELTGLCNRRHFTALTEKEISRSGRSGKNLSLLFLDVDHFKAVNDSYGHDCGDIVLRELGAILKSATREFDIPCRYGGEEFAVLLPETPGESALAIAERLRLNISEREIPCAGKSLSISVSIGVSMLNEDEELDTLLKNADKALYEAKAGGRNRSILYRHAVQPGNLINSDN